MRGTKGSTAVEAMIVIPLVVALFAVVIWFAVMCVDTGLAHFTMLQLSRAHTQYVYPVTYDGDDNPMVMPNMRDVK